MKLRRVVIDQPYRFQKFDPSQPRDKEGKWRAGGSIHDKFGETYSIARKEKGGRYQYFISDEKGSAVGNAHLSAGNKRVMSVGVYPEFQRRGIASALYAHIESDLGYSLQQNWASTPDGDAFWNSRRRAVKFDPSQPRAPAGTDIGGQWVASGLTNRTREQQDDLQAALDQHADDAPTVEQRVAIEDLLGDPRQPNVMAREVENYRRQLVAGTAEPIDVIRYKGQLYLDNGKHRVAAALKQGLTTIKADVLDLDAVVKAFDPNQPRDKDGKWTDAFSVESGYHHHVTNLERLTSIADDGALKPHAFDYGTEQSSWPDGSTQERSYFTNSKTMLEAFAPEEGTPVVLRVPTSAARFKTEAGTGDVFATKPIAASNLEYFDGEWKPLSSIKKTFDPNQPRDKDGKWTSLQVGDFADVADVARAADVGSYALYQRLDRAWTAGVDYSAKEDLAHLLVADDQVRAVTLLETYQNLVGLNAATEQGFDEWLKTPLTLYRFGSAGEPFSSWSLSEARARDASGSDASDTPSVLRVAPSAWLGTGAGGAEIYITPDVAEEFKKYDPNQPRAPKGDVKGGQWVGNTGFEGGKANAYVYHGTSSAALKNILKNGLIPSKSEGADAWAKKEGWDVHTYKSGDRKLSVFVSSQQSIAKLFAGYAVKVNPGTRPVMLRIRLPAEMYSKLVPDENLTDDALLGSMDRRGMRLKGKIKPEWIEAYQFTKAASDKHLYGVFLVDFTVEKDFNPAQPRAPKGTPEGGRWTKEQLYAEGVRQMQEDKKRDGLLTSGDTILSLGSPYRRSDAATDEIMTVANASTLEAAKRVIDSQTKWQGSTFGSTDEWLGAEAAGANGLMPRGMKGQLAELSMEKRTLSGSELKAFTARQEWMQKAFREEYGESLTLYRGVKGPIVRKILASRAGSGMEVDLPSYGLSSWTTSLHVAREFTGSRGTGLVLSTTVTPEEVWLLPRRGVESPIRIADAGNEVVVLNKQPTRKVSLV